jgi:hypothetical protein
MQLIFLVVYEKVHHLRYELDEIIGRLCKQSDEGAFEI